MNPFVRVINTQLFKRIMIENFKTVNIQHFNNFHMFFCSLAFIDFLVELFDNPKKQILV